MHMNDTCYLEVVYLCLFLLKMYKPNMEIIKKMLVKITPSILIMICLESCILSCVDIKRMSCINKIMCIAMMNYDVECIKLVMTSRWYMHTSICLHIRNWYILFIEIYPVFLYWKIRCLPIWFIVGFVYVLTSRGSHPFIPFFRRCLITCAALGTLKVWRKACGQMLSFTLDSTFLLDIIMGLY